MKKIFIFISILIILSGISLLGYSLYNDFCIKEEDNEHLEEFFENFDDSEVEEIVEEDNTNNEVQDTSYYTAVIEIPNIGLNTGIIRSDSAFTTINRNVSIYPTSDMPNKQNGWYK